MVGWKIEPSTKEEREHLKYLINALEIAYGDPSVVTIEGERFCIKSIPIPECLDQ